MKIEDVKIGETYDCKVEEDMDYAFQGKVEKVYEHSALVEITKNDPKDDSNKMELNNKIVVSAKKMTKAK
ncbi:DUF2187 family protein [Companilactobacillus mishanensis]|uniref:DUF2187 domain-containing protein n=1 Tax=Companilactobacillus mishanensis TaxID=2486008 RepID=A0A5P0ZIS9_9LACO|nr:DUF2187 family protein [Companilactobacillus mishanensis]MQS44725.1 DUF2187 domain-containing protein [Companilactobacillus mishanensis]MQS52999.1 DUF2187 domain-containing protein [Companilactobacillus mishanensis]MQS89833.1 DUF2187 domain-containing protein [Companilactobacillus mishanensis]